MTPVVVTQITEHPNTGPVHFHDRRHAFRRAEPEHRNFCGRRDRIAVECHDHFERVPRKREAANLSGAAVEHVEQDALALLDANRLAVTEHAAVDREQPIADLVTLRLSLRQGRLHRRFARYLELFDSIVRCKKIHRHVAAAAERRREFLEHEKHFLVVAARFVSGLDIDRADLTAVLAGAEIVARDQMRVIKAEAGRPGHKGDAAHAVCRDERCAFLSRTVHLHRHELTVPVQLLGRVGVIVDVDDDTPPLF